MAQCAVCLACLEPSTLIDETLACLWSVVPPGVTPCLLGEDLLCSDTLVGGNPVESHCIHGADRAPPLPSQIMNRYGSSHFF